MFNVKAIFLSAALLTMAGSAYADGRAPTSDEQTAISGALKAEGFESWSSIELDDGKWEIDNAVHADGKIYDVDLRPNDLSTLKKDLED